MLTNIHWIFWVLVIFLIIIIICRIFFNAESKFVGIKDISRGLNSRYLYQDFSSRESQEVETNQTNQTNQNVPEREQTSSRSSEFNSRELEEFYVCKRPFIGSNSSKGERICRKFLQRYFELPFKSCRPHFLTNPETKAPLELDCYEGSLRLAVEYQGRQHYEFTPAFHADISDFLEQQRKDQFKAEICSRLGIYLIRVPYTIKPEDISEFIRLRLPQHLRKLSSRRLS